MPCSSSWTGSLLVKPVAASTAPCSTAASWVKSGYSTIWTSSVVRFGRRQQRLEHDPARSVAAGRPDLLALEVGRLGDPRRRLGEDDVRELAVDGRDVLDRDGVAGGRDDARAVADPDVDRARADERDEVRVDLVLELDRRGRRRRSSRSAGRGRTGRTGRSGCSRGRPRASSARRSVRRSRRARPRTSEDSMAASTTSRRTR